MTTQKDQMRWVLFSVFLTLFTLMVVGTLGMVFFNFGDPTETERELMVKGLIGEVAACMIALFYSIFGLKGDVESPNKLQEIDEIVAQALSKRETAKLGISKLSASGDEKPASEEKDSQIDGVEPKEGEWLSKMSDAFNKGDFNDAEKVFKKYVLDEKNEIELHANKGFYLYSRFKKAKDNSAIEELEDLARTAKTEESKFDSLIWLSLCFQDGMQYEKEIKLWRSTSVETKSEVLKTKSIVLLAYVLNKNDKPIEAKGLLVERLLATVDVALKASLYEALSRIEGSLGNKSLSIYCKDKSLEFDENNRDELFNSAYSASDEYIDEVTISNYIKLIRIDSDNSMALNNLGVRAQKEGLKIKAIENYKKASDYNNTLAMANQGYALLGAGFSDEAENIANKALELDNPHKNVHSLISAIDEKKKEQNKDWVKLQEKSFERQRIIRKYTEQYYLGNPNSLKGDWLVSNIYPTTIVIENDLITATWVEQLFGGGSSVTVELVGKVIGSTFEGKYTRKRDKISPDPILGLGENTNQSCIGYISEDGTKIELISSKFKDNFSLCLSKPKS